MHWAALNSTAVVLRTVQGVEAGTLPAPWGSSWAAPQCPASQPSALPSASYAALRPSPSVHTGNNIIDDEWTRIERLAAGRRCPAADGTASLTLALCLSLAYCSARTCLLAIPLVSCPTVGAGCPLASPLRFLSSFFCILANPAVQTLTHRVYDVSMKLFRS